MARRVLTEPAHRREPRRAAPTARPSRAPARTARTPGGPRAAAAPRARTTSRAARRSREPRRRRPRSDASPIRRPCCAVSASVIAATSSSSCAVRVGRAGEARVVDPFRDDRARARARPTRRRARRRRTASRRRPGRAGRGRGDRAGPGRAAASGGRPVVEHEVVGVDVAGARDHAGLDVLARARWLSRAQSPSINAVAVGDARAGVGVGVVGRRVARARPGRTRRRTARSAWSGTPAACSTGPRDP